MRVTVLHNPEAGDDALSADELRTLLRSAGFGGTYRSTKTKGWEKALDDPGDLVVVAGGDGTVAQVARRLAGRGVPIALLPAGTANNIARSFGLEDDPRRLVARWATARATPIDLGLIAGSMGERLFVESVGLGVFPRLMAESERRISKETTPVTAQIPRNIELMIELLEHAVPVPCEITADGQDLTGEFLVLELMNIRSIGPRVVFSADADATDGLLDIVAITDAERDTAIEFLRCCRDDEEAALDLPRMRATDIRLAWEGAPVHIDDERWPEGNDSRDDGSESFSASITVARGAAELLI